MGTSRPGRDASLVGPEKSSGQSLQRDVEVLSRERAKGDEAYSVAMLLSEYGARLDAPPLYPNVATDLDEKSLRAAREGLYLETIAATIATVFLDRSLRIKR